MSSKCDLNKFSFPYEPYQIQVDFMTELYDVLENKKIGIFESPTGTGKSLSIICGTLTWLNDYKNKRINQINQNLDELNEKIKQIELEEKQSDNWIKLHEKKRNHTYDRDYYRQELEKVNHFIKRNEELKKVKIKSQPKKSDYSNRDVKKLKTDPDTDDNIEDDYEFVINFDDDSESVSESVEEKNDNSVKPKVFYCSRTHSQLSQFVNEIKKSPYVKSDDPLRLVVLGSRGNLCVNDKVSRLNNIHLINDRCLELQRQSTKCPMLKQSLINTFKDEILSDVLDIEDLLMSGRHNRVCGYYTTRHAICEAQLVILPYNILFHSKTRKSFGIDLSDSVVIVDEAHNLCEMINSIHSVELKAHQIINAHSQLSLYLTKYNKRLSPLSVVNIKQLLQILSAFIKYLNSDSSNKIHEPINFLIELKIENLNFFKLIEFCQNSCLARKLHGFSKSQLKCDQNKNSTSVKKDDLKSFLSKMKVKVKDSEVKENSNESDNKIDLCEDKLDQCQDKDKDHYQGSPMYSILEFLNAIINPEIDGRVIVSKDKENIKNSSIKYMPLNSSAHFKEITDKCRSIVLAGGTMQPYSEYMDFLFKPLGINTDEIKIFSCGHIIPKSNLTAIALGTGPCDKNLTYTFQNRNSKEIIDETGRLISNICNIIPGGIVCFFPSYEFEDKLYKHWQKSGIIKSIESKKRRVFREPKKASDVQSVLIEYSQCVRLNNKSSGGGLLLSIVGGKMSEGINFSDDLARCIIMIGLPYPNKNSPELQIKMNYLDSVTKDAGKSYYENLCMKAVNQSIGRSIRHKNDYAVILLLDSRYTNRDNIKNNLPKWISSQLVVYDKFPKAFSEIRNFFKTK